jgi:hypothetical protein
VHQFHGVTPALIGDECLKRANAILDDVRTHRYAERRTPRTSRKKPPLPPNVFRYVVRGRIVLETGEQRAERLAERAGTRPSRALPTRPCAGCTLPIVRLAKRGTIPKWCDDCNPHNHRRRHPVPVVRVAAGARV